MNDQEISKALALAIGWKPEHVTVTLSGYVWCCERIATLSSAAVWRTFDYRDPVVIWSIAEWSNVWPIKLSDSHWVSWRRMSLDCSKGATSYTAETAAKAVALAVIGVEK